LKIYYDDKLVGFGVRVTAAGYRSFVLRYRTKTGIQRTDTIGAVDTWTVVAARARAIEIKRSVDSGQDPQAERQADRDAPDMRALAERFESDHMPKLRPSTAKEYKDQIAKEILPKIGALKVAAVSYSDIDRLHRKMSEYAPYRANRVVALLSKMFSLSILWKMRAGNPCKGIQRNTEEERERYLTKAELVALVDAVASYPNQQVSNIIKLLLLTGARNSEVFKAKWSQFGDLDAGTWTKKAAFTKQEKLHHVHLNEPAIALLKLVREGATSDYVFPNPETGLPYTTIKKPWATICKAAGISNLRLYDCRHNFASVAINADVALPVISKLLGHTQPKTTLRYAHLYEGTIRSATAKVGRVIEDAGKVVRLPRK
jgi:integrase